MSDLLSHGLLYKEMVTLSGAVVNTEGEDFSKTDIKKDQQQGQLVFSGKWL